MIRLMMTCFALATSVMAFADGPTVSNVKAQQRYPWNALVDIDYTLSGDTTGLGVSISVRDVQNNMDYQPTKFMEVLPTTPGTHRVTWSPAADGISIISTNILVTVSLLRVAESPVTPNLYYVIDLSGGPDAVNYPITTLSAMPAGGWTDEYKTTKLVLRKIDAGTFMMGGSVSTTISQPFYIGVFEVTGKQYSLVMGGDGDMRPQMSISYNTIRGSSAGAGWPASSLVDGTSFFGKLRAKTGLDTFDLPTEAQWEYACRAGTTSTYNNGGNTEDDLKTLGRYSGNGSDGRGGYSSGATVVGSYSPNAWGLYDMHGNAYEWCLDWYGSLAGGTDPKGATSGSYRVVRGGSWYYAASDCTSSDRYDYPPSSGFNYIGFRLCCSAGL